MVEGIELLMMMETLKIGMKMVIHLAKNESGVLPIGTVQNSPGQEYLLAMNGLTGMKHTTLGIIHTEEMQ